MKKFYLGTRGSKLALWQANAAVSALKMAFPDTSFELRIYTSVGDLDQEKPLPKIGGKGVFTAALDDALLRQEIDLAVHSHKDLPIADSDPIVKACVLEREEAYDVVVAKGKACLADAPNGAVIGTSSTRRSSQLLAMGKSFALENIRGNVETRINKALDDNTNFFATVMAYAGLKRLNLLHYASEVLNFDQMLPAPAQGSIAIQCLKDSEIYAMCRSVDHFTTRLTTEAERGFLYGLGGGCSMPVAAYAVVLQGILSMQGKVLSIDGKNVIALKEKISVTSNFTYHHAFDFGISMANVALRQGAKNLLETFSN